jgi:hypothetical protein
MLADGDQYGLFAVCVVAILAMVIFKSRSK